jgi:hypothetical protein
MKYTTVEAIENYLLTEIDASFESQIEDWIEAMSSYVTKKTGRTFIADTDFSVKKYDADGDDSIIIDDAIDIDKVEISGQEREFVAYPANMLPYHTIKLTEGQFLPIGQQNVEVTAKWGYSVDVPDDIKFVTTVLVSGIIQHSLAHEGEVASMTLGRYSVAYKTEKQLSDFEQVKEILQLYPRYL